PSRAGRSAGERGAEAVAFADVLDRRDEQRPPGHVERGLAHDQQRFPRRDPQVPRLVRVRLAGLDRAVRADRLDPRLGQRAVQRLPGEVRRHLLGQHRHRDLGLVQRDRHAVEQPDPVEVEQVGAGDDGQVFGLVEAGGRGLRAQHLGLRFQAHPGGRLAERLQGVGPLPLRRGLDHVPAATVRGVQHAGLDEVVQRLAQGDPADAELLAELTLGWQARAGLERALVYLVPDQRRGLDPQRLRIVGPYYRDDFARVVHDVGLSRSTDYHCACSLSNAAARSWSGSATAVSRAPGAAARYPWACTRPWDPAAITAHVYEFMYFAS